jgi:hypothetical protein
VTGGASNGLSESNAVYVAGKWCSRIGVESQ